MTSKEDFASTVQATEDWIDDLARRLDWRDRERAYHALLAALHGFRDSLPRDEAVRLGSELPALLRGLYYEGWHPQARPRKSRDDFLQRIHDGVRQDPAVEPEGVARAVLALLAARLPPPELEDAKAATPKSLHNLWPS